MRPLTDRGSLKIYLGYAAGVGKTYQMLDDAQKLKTEGRDVVIGYFEPHGRADTIAKTEGIETIPRRRIDYRGSVFEELDTAAVLARHPEKCLVDELPHTNVPGAGPAKRWEDVLAMLDAGIGVFTTMNIQHLESLNDQVLHVTGVRVRETIPDWFLQQADEVVMVDLTPRALLNRLQRGVVYAPDKAQKAIENFFRESTLAALRELALRQTAHSVETRQVEPPSRHDRILIHITADPASAVLIRRGKRVADYLQADCFALAVVNGSPGEAIERHLNFARNLHIETRVAESDNVAQTLVDFARRNGVTQIFLARHRGRGLVQSVVRRAPDMQVIIVAPSP
jgi:two-component system sensor histidine kinase KdpD